jgi:hypothetical protein
MIGSRPSTTGLITDDYRLLGITKIGTLSKHSSAHVFATIQSIFFFNGRGENHPTKPRLSAKISFGELTYFSV